MTVETLKIYIHNTAVTESAQYKPLVAFKFLHSLVEWFLRYAVPDWLQHFFKFDTCYRFWVAIV